MSYYADDDPELLRATLAMIEAWDAQPGVLDALLIDAVAVDACGADAGAAQKCGGEEAPPAEEPVKREELGIARTETAPEVHQPTKNRSKRREEVIFLRDQASALQDQLARLRERNAVLQREEAASRADSTDKDMTLIWQQISDRQLQARQEAEVENIKLRTTLETQLKVARDLMRVIQRARRAERDDAFPVAKRVKIPIDASPDMSEQEQWHRLEQLSLQKNIVFGSAKFQSGSLTFVDVDVNSYEANQTVIDLTASWASPFTIEAVEEAAWEFLINKFDHKIMDTVSLDVASAGDTVISVFGAKALPPDLVQGEFYGKVVAKRFHHDGRQLIVQNMQVGPCGRIHANRAGWSQSVRASPCGNRPTALDDVLLIVNEDGWLRCKDCSNGNAAVVLTQVQSVRRFRVQFGVNEESPLLQDKIDSLTTFLLEQIKDQLQWHRQMMDNLLLRGHS